MLERKYTKSHTFAEKHQKKIILENWGQPGPEATCTQAAALRYPIRVHLKHLDQFENTQKNTKGCYEIEGVSSETSSMPNFREWNTYTGIKHRRAGVRTNNPKRGRVE